MSLSLYLSLLLYILVFLLENKGSEIQKKERNPKKERIQKKIVVYENVVNIAPLYILKLR
jgi:nitrogen fixation/metabolism regulation signal transduction histidine kinase